MMERSEHPCPAEWAWYYSFDGGEQYDGGPFASEEDAISAAVDDGAGEYQQKSDGQWREKFMVAECLRNHVNLSQYFDEDDWLDSVAEGMEDEDGPDEDGENHPLDELTKKDKADLGKAVRDALFAWQRDRQLPLKAFWFKSTRNEKKIDRPATRRMDG